MECFGMECKLKCWIINIVICSLVSLISLYILLALLYHKIRVEKPRQTGLLQLPIEKKYSILSKYACISINIASLVLFVCSVSFWLVEDIAISGFNKTAAETVCVGFSRIIITGFTVGNGLVYSFLWLRQRVIYVHPSLKVLNNKYVRVFSFLVLILWILFWISIVTAYFTKVQYNRSRNNGCSINEDSADPYKEIVVTWNGVSILMQISMLSLFIYPILKQASWRNQQSKPNLMRKVKKAVVFASICLGTDIVSIVVYSILGTECVANSTIWVFDISLLINHLITIGCFDHWKKLLWPWNEKISGVVRVESDSNETVPAAAFSASHSQSQLTTTT